MSPAKAVLLFLLLLTGLRLAYVGRVELSPDEAYYQMWSERLDWGYYSKGPGVAATIRAGTSLFGVNEFGVRFFSPMLALGTSLVLFALARRLYGDGPAAWTVVLLNVTPLFTAGSLLMTIDPLSVFFWSVAMATCWRALEEETSPGARFAWWLLTGAAVGLGFLAKYTNAAELLGIIMALWLVPRWRGQFRRPGFYAMLLVALAVGSPPFFWNASHAWITLNHLHDRGRLGSAFDRPLGEFGEFVGAHFGVYSPLVFAGLLVGLWWGWQRGRLRWTFWRRSARRNTAGTLLDAGAVRARFLLAFGLPLLTIYTVLSFKTAGEPNWTAPAFLSLSILAVALWHERARTSRLARSFCVAALAVGLLCSVAVLNTDNFRRLGIPWAYDRDPTARLLGWRSTAQSVETFRAEEERQLGAPVFLIANRYQLAAELNFYLRDHPAPALSPDHPAVYLPESQAIENQFSLWPGYDQVQAPPPRPPGAPAPTTAEEEFRGLGASPFVGRSALFITDDERRRRLPSSIESGFEECNLVARFEVRRQGQPLRRLRVYACFNYKGLDL